jgi:cytochrome c556
MKIKTIAAACCALLVANIAIAQTKPDETIKTRQATFNVVAANVGRIKANLDGEYKKDDVIKSAGVIQAIANAGIGSLFAPGTDKGVGFHETQIKPDALNPDNAKKLSDAVGGFKEQADQLVVIAGIGDKAAVQAQFGKLRGTCKSCHDNFRIDPTAAK